MAQRYRPSNDSSAAAIFAVTFVVLGGLGVCSAVTFTFNPKPFYAVIAIAAIFTSITFILVRIFFGGNENSIAVRSAEWIQGKKNAGTEEEYVPEIQPHQRGRSQIAPSVDSVQNLKNGTNNWVPSGKSQKRKKR